MARYVWDREQREFVDPQTREPMEITGDAICAPMIVSDIPAYMSPMGSGLIDGRKARREDMAKHNVREVAPDEWKPSEKFRERREREMHKRA